MKRHTISILSICILLLMPLSALAGDVRLVMQHLPGDNLDPTFDYSGWYVRESGIVETLFAFDQDMNLVPELATGYEMASDKEWIIKLREGVEFHDGTPLNADAVIYSLHRVMDDPNNKWHDRFDFVDSVDAQDDHTIKITTKEVYAPTLAALADVRIASIVSPAATDLEHHPVGTGPFKFVSYEPDVKLVLEKNENYWKGPVKADRATVSYISQPETRALMLEGGEADIVWALPAQWYETIDDAPSTKVVSKDTMRTYFMFVNTAKPPLDKVEVRQAISYAIDREELVDSALEGVAGTPAKGFWSSNYPWSVNDEIEGYPYNPERAKELLESAGLTWDGQAWLYDGQPFELVIKTYTSRPANKPSAELVASQLEKIGIKASITTLEGAAITSDMSKGDYDLALYAYGTATSGDPDYFVSQQFLSSGTEAGYTRYSGIDDMILKGRSTLDENERMKIYKQIQERVLQDCPEIFLFYDRMMVGVSDKVEGFEIYPNEITIITDKVNVL